MEITELGRLSGKTAEAWWSRIPFFRELATTHRDQLDALLLNCCLVQLAPGEVIMRKGEEGTWLYFLLKGALSVYRERPGEGMPLSEITPGELFGDLALVGNNVRKATVAALPERGATLLACDFKTFGSLHDFKRIGLETKLAFYRMLLHSIRWRLEVHRNKEPGHPLIAELLSAPAFSGNRHSEAELEYLFNQARYMAGLLERWNGDAVHPPLAAVKLYER